MKWFVAGLLLCGLGAGCSAGQSDCASQVAGCVSKVMPCVINCATQAGCDVSACRSDAVNALVGYRTYIALGLAVVVVGLNAAGVIDDATAKVLLEALGIGSLAALRAAVGRQS